MRLLRKSKAALVGGLFHFSVTKRPGGLFWAQRGLWIRSGGPQAAKSPLKGRTHGRGPLSHLGAI
jgi:hypothetical protein